MTQIRLLHASDLHIAAIANLKSPKDSPNLRNFVRAFRYGAAATSYDPTLLKAFSDFVLREPSLDAVVLTGDIATTGDYRDLMKAFRFIEGAGASPLMGAPFSLFSEATLELFKRPVFLIPGNHDRYLKTLTIFEPGGTDFHDIFSHYWVGNVRAYPYLGDESLSVSVLGADFSLKNAEDCGWSPINKYAQGKVYDDILAQLEEETVRRINMNSSRKVLTLWAVHFPPQYGGLSSKMRLMDSKKLVDAANRLGVVALLSGHTHHPRKYSNRTMRFDVMCAGTVSEFQSKHNHHFQILNITNEFNSPLISLDHYEFDRRLARFTLSNPKQ